MKREARQTGDLPAIHAHEVRMLVRVPLPFRIAQLEPPDVVSHVGPRQDVRLGQVDEDPVDGRPVEATVIERLAELGVAVLPPMLVKVLEHREPRCRAPQADAPQHLLQLFHRRQRLPRYSLHESFNRTVETIRTAFRHACKPARCPAFQLVLARSN